MLDGRQFDHVLGAFPAVAAAGAEVLEEFRRASVVVSIPAGQDVFVEGGQVEGIAFLLSGTVRVYKIGETGREITLYRFGHGESCILTAAAILNQQRFSALATVERDVEAVLVPAPVFRDWVRRFDFSRDFVLELLTERLADVMAIVDEVAFRRMDRRIATLLVDRAISENPVRATHHEVAADLGSSREVISRIVEDLSERGLVRPLRGAIEVLDAGGLRRLAEGD